MLRDLCVVAYFHLVVSRGRLWLWRELRKAVRV
jgi:hypothetical protein